VILKDRMVTLSPVLLLVMLREYWKAGKISKEGYLFPGQYKDESYSSGQEKGGSTKAGKHSCIAAQLCHSLA